MFDFQKEVIINSNKLEDGVTPRFMAMDGAVKLFRVLRCADYRKEGLIDGVIYRTTPNAGAVATATLNVPKNAGTYRVVIGISLIGKYLSDYAMPWSKFGKAVLAEFELSAADLADAQKIMVKAVESAIPENYKYVRVSKSGADKILISCTDSHQILSVAELQKQEDIDCPESCTEKQYVKVENAVKVTDNEMEIGTAAWIQENLRFPSYPNLRYAALNEEEYPVKGGLYYQYSFGYCSPRRGLHGQGTVGQALKSITTHTFYVLDALHAEFEKAITDAFGDVFVDVPNTLFKIEILNDASLTIADITTNKASIKQTISGPAITGDVTKDVEYTVSNKDDKYVIGTDGLLAVASEKTAAVGDQLTVTVSYYGSKASKEFTVIA